MPALHPFRLRPKKAATLAALDDEYPARATDQAVRGRLGTVQPFDNILKAEERPIAALTGVLWEAGEAIPPNPWLNGEKPPIARGPRRRLQP